MNQLHNWTNSCRCRPSCSERLRWFIISVTSCCKRSKPVERKYWSFCCPRKPPNSLTVNVASETVISINSYTSQQALDSVHELPAMLVKDVFSGEFMNLSKLWLRNFNSLEPLHDEPLTLTVENVDNSVIRVNKAEATSITNIQGWTSAFTAHMSVVISKHQNRATELLEYLCLNHYAGKYHRAKGWCVYDVKFRQKAASSYSITWSVIDS